MGNKVVPRFAQNEIGQGNNDIDYKDNMKKRYPVFINTFEN